MSEDDEAYPGMFDEQVDLPKGNGGAGIGQQGASLPEIKLDDGNLHGVIEQAEKAILAAPKQRLFQRAGMLVRLKRIAQKTTIKGVTRDAGSLIIAEATSECVRLEMARTARYLKWNARSRKYVVTDPPIKYARAIAA